MDAPPETNRLRPIVLAAPALALLAWLSNVGATAVLAWALGPPLRTTTDAVVETGGGPAALLLVSLVLAPLLETIAWQIVPIEVLAAWRVPALARRIASTLLFGASHLNAGAYGVAVGLAVGPWLAYAYDSRRGSSRLRGAWLAVLVHVLHNAIALGFGRIAR